MKRKNALWIILEIVFPAIFNVIFFTVGGTVHIASVWISYAFIHFAYLMLLLTPKLIRQGKSSTVFGFSLYSISSVYFLVEFIAGMVFILLSPEKYLFAFILQLCIAGLYVIVLVSNLIANEHTAKAEEERQNQILFIKDISAKIKKLIKSAKDKEAKKNLEQLYDAVSSSPVKSHPNLKETEDRILFSIHLLEESIASGNKDDVTVTVQSLLMSMEERNNLLKMLH